MNLPFERNKYRERGGLVVHKCEQINEFVSREWIYWEREGGKPKREGGRSCSQWNGVKNVTGDGGLLSLGVCYCRLSVFKILIFLILFFLSFIKV